MRSTILYALMTALLASTSVSGGNAQTQSSDRYRPSYGGYENPRPRPLTKQVESPFKEAYTENRWVGLLSPGIDHCPDVEGWVPETLLDQVLRGTLEDGELRAPSDLRARLFHDPSLSKLGLERYCIYTPKKGPRKDFRQPAGLAKPTRDRLSLAITSSGGAPTDILGERIWPILAAHFRDQTGQEPSLLLQGKPSVRLTFIDSQPNEEENFKKPLGTDSLHGYTLVRLAQDMLCPSPSPCPVKIATRRALSYQKFDSKQPFPPDPIQSGQSGHVGLVSELAAAIYAEVLYWRQVEPDKKLILNLSLGWDGEGFRDLDARRVSDLEPSVQAVYNALRFARKSGALVIAAAGNQRGGGGTRWPLLPAAWELRRPNWLRWSVFGKPVYAVGGVDWQGLPLANSRAGGRPRRVAYADHSVTYADDPDTPTAIYTGTSVSSAVVSSIAAAVWHLRPELRPAQVMRLLCRSGNKLDTRADFYAWKRPKPFAKLVAAPRVKRLSFCPAIAKACGRDGRRCSALASAPACPQWVSKAPEIWPPIKTLLPGQEIESMPMSENPLKQLFDAANQRWVLPQPPNDPCPGCTLVQKPPPAQSTTNPDPDPNAGSGSSTQSLDYSTTSSTQPDPQLYQMVIAIGSLWGSENPDAKIVDAALEIVRSVDGEVTDTMIYKLTIPPMISGDTYIATDLGDGDSLANCTAQLIFKVRKPDETEMSVLNPVIVQP